MLHKSKFGSSILLATFASVIMVPLVSARIIEVAGEVGINAAYLGTADGKSFFAEMTPKRTWEQAKAYCTESSMHLASITSPEQHTLLTQAKNEATFLGEFWTGGRDAQTITQYLWDHDKQQPGSFLPLVGIPPIRTCLTFDTDNIVDAPEYNGRSCNDTYGTLCEVIHGRKHA